MPHSCRYHVMDVAFMLFARRAGDLVGVRGVADVVARRAGLGGYHGRGWPSRKKPPVGPVSGRVAAQTMPAAPSATGRPPGPPMSVATQPGQIALTRIPSPRSSAASIRVSALRATLEAL